MSRFSGTKFLRELLGDPPLKAAVDCNHVHVKGHIHFSRLLTYFHVLYLGIEAVVATPQICPSTLKNGAKLKVAGDKMSRFVRPVR